VTTFVLFGEEGHPEVRSGFETGDWDPSREGFAWIDFEAPTDRELRALTEPFGFHPLAIDDCLTPEHQPKVESFGSHLFLIARGIDFNPPVEGFQTIKLAAFLGPGYLVTYHRRPMRSVDTILDRFRTVPGEATAPPGPTRLLVQILDQMIEYYFPVLEAVEEELDELEEAIFLGEGGTETLDRLLQARRKVVEVRRTISPHREAFARIARGEFPQVEEVNLVFWRDLFDSVHRLTEEADTYRDLLGSTLDAHLSMTSHRLNEVMKVLTIFATIMLPLTFIVGVYGMNFDYIPELHWRYGYFAVWAVMIGVVAGLLRFFRRRGWI